jgi:hypothetical protein
VLSAAPEDDMMGTQPFSRPAMSPSPKARSPTPERQQSPDPSDDSTSLQSSISDTINQSVSMGQWLLSKSDGEVADYILDDGMCIGYLFPSIRVRVRIVVFEATFNNISVILWPPPSIKFNIQENMNSEYRFQKAKTQVVLCIQALILNVLKMKNS